MKTQHFLLSGLVLLATSLSVYAQEKKEAESTFGIKGGLNYSTISKGNFNEGPDPRTSFYVGFVGEIPIIKNVFAVQPELLYSRQGFITNTTFLGTNYKTDYKLDYINAPILAKIYLGKVFSIEAGPQFGLKINEKRENENSSVATNNINDFDTALALGASLNFDEGFFISGRFTQSLNEVVKDSGSKNQVFQVGAGFKF